MLRKHSTVLAYGPEPPVDNFVSCCLFTEGVAIGTQQRRRHAQARAITGREMQHAMCVLLCELLSAVACVTDSVMLLACQHAPYDHRPLVLAASLVVCRPGGKFHFTDARKGGRMLVHCCVCCWSSCSGGVVRVVLSSSGAMLGPPQLFSRVCIRRPSGLSFDHQGEHSKMQQRRLLTAFVPDQTSIGPGSSVPFRCCRCSTPSFVCLVDEQVLRAAGT